jgi:hypothetical protein
VLRLLLDAVLLALLRRVDRVPLARGRRELLLRVRDVRAVPERALADEDRRRAVERDRLDVERFRGERRDELLDARLRPRVDDVLFAIPSHSP